ncbi:hypothetical protein ACHQM5_003405 [Ranunculus cassubicifolius]
MAAIYILILHSCILTLFTQCIPIVAYTLRPSESITDGEILTTQGGTFELGFFSPSTTSNKRYLGIWYKALPERTVVWVANRDSPIHDRSGVLKIGSTGNLILVANQADPVIWSSSSPQVVKNPVVEFLDSGNLIVRDLGNADSSSYLWQSFDYPTDTLLPGMKLGWNKKTGLNRYLSSWKNTDDPSPGDYTYGLEHVGYPEFIMRKGPNQHYRAGSWNGIQANGIPELKPNPQFTYKYIDNDEEAYFMYQMVNHSIIMRYVLVQTSTEGFCKLLTWVDKIDNWVVQVMLPKDHCDDYALCGAYSTCDVSSIEVCQCLKGFKPKSQADWSQFDWSMGCERQEPVECRKGEAFRSYTGVKLPQTTAGSWVNVSMNLEECREKCLSNCSCMAYSSSDIKGGERGCILWFSDLIDMRNLKGVRQDLYVRMAASEIRLDSQSLGNTSKMKKRLTLVVSFTSVFGATLLSLGGWYIRKKLSRKGKMWYGLLGMLDGEEIAVKRLSKNSIQGVDEFRNEVMLISKLQHRNLVRLLGCCIQGEEMTLIYEFMQNNSLESFIFDETRRQLLNWKQRAQIIAGIARGLLYLHHDSRLRIIHRDLKASNILLDSELVAKISDFGLARIFGGDQMEARTRRVVGTRGYMSPEYAIDGNFSMKSDVFSFGVLVLEIISGKRNRGFCHPDHEHNLLGHVSQTLQYLLICSLFHTCIHLFRLSNESLQFGLF